MGRIGEAIALRCHFGFGMDVLYYSRSPKKLDFPATQLATVTDIMANSNFVLLSTLRRAETRHLIGTAKLATVKPGGILINPDSV